MFIFSSETREQKMSSSTPKRPRLPGKCPICRERRVDFVTEPFEMTVDHDGRSYNLSIPDLTLLKCGACGNRTLHMEADERMNQALRNAAGFLNPPEIRELRVRLQMTQAQLADL